MEIDFGFFVPPSRVVQELKKLDESLTPQDQLCVEIAGLLHDLRHGPFSHLWESFTKLANPESGWEHEKSSIDMMDLMVTNNSIRLEDYGLELAKDLEFIKELIDGPLDADKPGYSYRGRGPSPLWRRPCLQLQAGPTLGLEDDIL